VAAVLRGPGAGVGADRLKLFTTESKLVGPALNARNIASWIEPIVLAFCILSGHAAENNPAGFLELRVACDLRDPCGSKFATELSLSSVSLLLQPRVLEVLYRRRRAGGLRGSTPTDSIA
jgi:hypothetical protein